MNTEAPKSIPPEQIFGTAKKLHLELEKLNMVDHAAVLNMLNTAAQHREMSAKFERAQAEEKARQDAYEDAVKAHERGEVERQRKLSEQMRAHLEKAAAPVLVTG
jgi:uncharacterized protein YaiL (DUF2058 family)